MGPGCLFIGTQPLGKPVYEFRKVAFQAGSFVLVIKICLYATVDHRRYLWQHFLSWGFTLSITQFLNCGTGCSHTEAITQATCCVLTNSFLCGFMICHLNSNSVSKKECKYKHTPEKQKIFFTLLVIKTKLLVKIADSRVCADNNRHAFRIFINTPGKFRTETS